MSRIETLLAEMTLAEKLGQMTMVGSSFAVTGPVFGGESPEAIRDGSIGTLANLVGAERQREVQRIAVEESRLGIPLLIGFDIIHGHRTLFPIPLGEASLFDPEAWELTAREAAREGSSDGLTMTFAPMLDVSRDPRWGRTAEGPGEDPYVAQQVARAKVRGFQGMDPADRESLAACAKHFCAYGPVMAGREYASVDISERTLREVHLPGFAAAVEADVLAIMPAFTDLGGIPMSAHTGLLRDYLRGELGWEGVLLSDYNAIGELIRHGVAGDVVEAAALALNATMDIDMISLAYRKGLPEALDRGLVKMEQIDAAVRRVLTLKERLGLFDDPYGRGTTAEDPAVVSRRQSLAREIGARSLVLLKNERDALPLPSSVGRLAVIGPLADAPGQMRGTWSAAAWSAPNVGVLEGLGEALSGCDIAHEAGVAFAIGDEDRSGIADAVAACDGVDAIVLCLGEGADMSGEAASRSDLGLPGQQRALAEAVIERARANGTPVIAVVFSGRPLVLTWLAERVDALLAAWFPGKNAGHAIADVLTGVVFPSGRTPITWPRALGQVPIFFGQRPSGRWMDPDDKFTSKYLDVPNEPLYPFGHGLTYTTFSYANLRAGPAVVTESDRIDVSVDVTNTGDRAGTETVFLFTRDVVASVTRPLLELRGFTKVTLEPGQTESVSLAVNAADLRLLDASLRPVFEPGDVEVLVGPCADRARLLVATVRLRG